MCYQPYLMPFRRIDSAICKGNHCNPERVSIQCRIVAAECDHRTSSTDEASEKFPSVFMSSKNSSSNTIRYLVNLNKDLDLMLIHALSWVTFHHIMQGIFNSAPLSTVSVSNWNIVNRHLRFKT